MLSSVDQVPAALVGALTPYLQPVGGVPDPAVIVVHLTPKELGLGGLRGLGRVGPFEAVELRGGQVEAVVRFQLWGDGFDPVNQHMLDLQGRLLSARDDLFEAGVLELGGVAGTLPVEQGGNWFRTADYRVLFEYHLTPASAAESLIARIPIRADQEVEQSPAGETTTVTDDLVRWDEVTAPSLVLRGAGTVARLAVASFVPGTTPSGKVRVLRTRDGAVGPPTTFPTLPSFLAALTDPSAPETHVQLDFTSVADFLGTFTVTGDPFPVGDWDANGVPDDYQVAELELTPAIPLPQARDRIEISLETTPFDQVAVVYLRAAGTFG